MCLCRIAVIYRIGLVLTVILLPLGAHAAANTAVDYSAQIKPLLRERCFACHGVLKQEGGLRLDTARDMLDGGDSGPAILAGEAERSLLYERISSDDDDYRMPPEGAALTRQQQDLIRTWIAGGADHPEDEQREPDVHQHWAFQPPVAAAPPTLADTGNANPIDAFLAAAQQASGVTPVPRAQRSLLLRRLYLDLIGLPPTAEQLRDFESDARPDAYARQVDRLLADPRYGERWARHWMDVWRYSDWYGLGDQLRYSQKHIWHWRDWILESLNDDRGYDQLVQQMLAADEINPTNRSDLRATGYLARNYFLFNRTTWLDDTIEHTAKSLLGLTLNCAKCHDHKYDPISQEDYYRYRAFFEPHHVRLDPVPGTMDREVNGLPRVYDAHLDRPTHLLVRGDPTLPDTSRPLSPAPPSIFTVPADEILPIELPPTAHTPELLPFVRQEMLAEHDAQIAAAAAKLQQLEPAASEDLPPREQASAAGVTQPGSLGEAELLLAEQELAYQRSRRQQSVAALHAWQRERTQHGPGEDPTTGPITGQNEAAGAGQNEAAGAGQNEAAGAGQNEAAGAGQNEAARAAAVAAGEAALAKARVDLAQLYLQQFQDAEAGAGGTNEQESSASPAADDLSQRLAQGAAQIQELQAKLANVDSDYPRVTASLKALEGPDETAESRRQPYPRLSSGRRRALATWITHPENPLTARVAVNHIWLRHFGQPLVDPVTDFGLRTPAPRHQALLDWLAVHFQRNGWRMKWLHRQIVLSDAYQRSTGVPDSYRESLAKDADNHDYWRRLPVRMESQMVRDSLLHLAGRLDPTMYGPSVAAKEFADSCRRSLYLVHSRDERHPFLQMFDDADILRCYRRSESIIPQQALAMSNSKLALSMAAAVADRIQQQLDSAGPQAERDQQFIDAACFAILGRTANGLEQQACQRALDQWRDAVAGAPGPDAPENSPPAATAEIAYQRLIHAILNHNDFITIR